MREATLEGVEFCAGAMIGTGRDLPSYLSGNRLAESAWHGLGFRPFRVQAFRRVVR